MTPWQLRSLRNSPPYRHDFHGAWAKPPYHHEDEEEGKKGLEEEEEEASPPNAIPGFVAGSNIIV